MDIVRIMNSLIADEYFAFTQYTFLEVVAKGKGLNALSEKFKEIAKDELEDHFKKLCDWAHVNDIAVETQLGNLIKVANCPMDYFDDPTDTDKATVLSLSAEQKAIDAYLRFAKEVQEEYPELAQMFLQLATEEQGHKKDILDLISEISNYISEKDQTLSTFNKDADDLISKMKNFADKFIDNSKNTKNFSEESDQKIDKDACKEYAMSIATEIFGDKTDETIVDGIVDNAIDKSEGDQSAAMGIIKNSFHKNFSDVTNSVHQRLNLSDAGTTDINDVRSRIVPPSGKCDTIEGEILRAIDKIYYSFYNGGQMIERSYQEYVDSGADKVPAIYKAYKFLVSPELHQYMESDTVKDLDNLARILVDGEYKKLLEKIMTDISNMLIQVSNYSPNTTGMDYLEYEV